MASIIILLAYVSTLNLSPLLEPDEARYGEIAREMLLRGDWVTPTLNFVKYFEKPPLLYWLIASSMAVFGQKDWVVRLWPALFGLLGVACTAYLGASMYGSAVGLVSAIVLATMPLYFGLSQVAILDMPLTALCTVCHAMAWRASLREANTAARLEAILFWLALALAVLVKGPVAVVLVGSVVVLYGFVVGEPLWWRRLLWWPAVVAGVAVVAPWFVLVSWRNPEFLRFFFLEQHVFRYARPSEHQEPIWFYVPVLLAATAPWWLVASHHVLCGTAKISWPRRQAWYLAVWFTAVFLFFSFSGSKLGTYILPALPPLGILYAVAIVRGAPGGNAVPYRWLAIAALVLGFALVAGARVVPIISSHHRAELLPPYLLAGGVLLLMVSGALFWASKGAPTRYWLVFGALAVCMVWIEVATFASRSVAEHHAPLAAAIRERWRPGDLIVLYRHYTQGIPYYTGQRVILVGSWGELDFGRRHGNHEEFFWADDQQLFRAWQDRERVFLVINKADLSRIHDSLVPVPQVVARWGKKVVVVNFQP